MAMKLVCLLPCVSYLFAPITQAYLVMHAIVRLTNKHFKHFLMFICAIVTDNDCVDYLHE